MRLLDIAIIGLCEFVVVGRPIHGAWLHDEKDSSSLLGLYGDFVADLVIGGIGRQAATAATKPSARVAGKAR